jgi:hypothetical protein
MQNQFDQWYSNLHSHDIVVHNKSQPYSTQLNNQDTLNNKISTKKNMIAESKSANDIADVNEDILAFYQAKEEMLKRRGER